MASRTEFSLSLSSPPLRAQEPTLLLLLSCRLLWLIPIQLALPLPAVENLPCHLHTLPISCFPCCVPVLVQIGEEVEKALAKMMPSQPRLQGPR